MLSLSFCRVNNTRGVLLDSFKLYDLCRPFPFFCKRHELPTRERTLLLPGEVVLFQ